jgi:hypothetical protein
VAAHPDGRARRSAVAHGLRAQVWGVSLTAGLGTSGLGARDALAQARAPTVTAMRERLQRAGLTDIAEKLDAA